MKKNLLVGALFCFFKLIIGAKNKETLQNCSAVCVSEGSYMDCRSNHLTHINVNLRSHTKYLDFSFNHIRRLNKASFPPQDSFKNLLYLNVSNNDIDIVTVDSFAHLLRIEVIDLSRNRIKYLDDHLIEGNIHLNMLILDDNVLAINASKTLLRSQSLRILSMRRAGIQSIGATSFSELPSLEDLDLSLNKLSIINQYAFNSLQHLRWLDLSANDWSCEESLAKMVSDLTNRGVNVRLRDCGVSDPLNMHENLQHISQSISDEIESQTQAPFCSYAGNEICQQRCDALCTQNRNNGDSKIFTKANYTIFGMGIAFALFVSLLLLAVVRIIKNQIAKWRSSRKGTYKLRKLAFTLDTVPNDAQQSEALKA